MVRSFEEGEVYSRPYFERPVKKAEPALEPPDTARYITAGCGHEVYEGEELFESEEEGTLCRECMEELVGEIPIRELAELLGCACVEVMFPAGCVEKD